MFQFDSTNPISKTVEVMMKLHVIVEKIAFKFN